MSLARLLESLHGAIGVLATAALVHPALLLRRGKPLTPRSRWAVALAGLLAALAWSAGAFIYGDYRRLVKRTLFQKSVGAGLAFETKEHVAVTVACLAIGALVAALVAPRESRELRRAAALSFGLAAGLSGLVVGLGWYVTAVHGF
ncbi:MAG: hypothetical protein OZ921_08715 [Sorangiineae bacterium]|nr:hypothetical protein [Polyangiaceae bacterium]MEB2322582.1 hypothetical protein [Sorangiineae bacterium]